MDKLPKPFKINQLQPEISTEQAVFSSLSKDVIELQKKLIDQQLDNY